MLFAGLTLVAALFVASASRRVLAHGRGIEPACDWYVFGTPSNQAKAT